MKTFLLRGATVLALCLAAALSAYGELVYTNETDFVSALGGSPSYLNDFNDLTDADAFAHPLNYSSNGMAYSMTSIPLINLMSIVGAVSTVHATDDILVSFASGNVGAVGGWCYLVDSNAVPVGGTVSLTVSNSTTNIVISTTSISPPLFTGFISSGQVITSLRIHSGTAGGFPALDHFYAAQGSSMLTAAISAVNGLTLSWPASATGLVLQATSQLPVTNWTNVTVAPQQVGNQMQVVVPASASRAFYRLLKQ